MTSSAAVRTQEPQKKSFFLCAFIFSCFLFWWLPSVLFRLVAHTADEVTSQTIAVSVAALGLFAAGYLIPAGRRGASFVPDELFASTRNFAFSATLALALPALAVAVWLFHSRAGVDYGTGDPIPTLDQALLYAHLFFAFMYLGAAEPEKEGWRRVGIVVVIVSLPRLIDSLRGGRFFLAQAVVPAVFIAVARGWIRFSARRIAQFVLLALAIVFIPSITRGDSYIGRDEAVQFFASGSSLRTYQDNVDLNLNGRCPPLLVSLTAKLFPYHLLGVCTIDVWRSAGLPATLDRILAYNEPGSAILLTGPGSNYLLELSLGGGLPALFIGSVLFGLACSRFVVWSGRCSLFAGIWAECLTRALLAPRGNLGYVFERIPSLVLATLFVLVCIAAWRLLQQDFARGRMHMLPTPGAPQ
jgi:hypothetical protein